MKKIVCTSLLFLLMITGCSSHNFRVSGGFVSFYLKMKGARSVDFLYSVDDYRNHPAVRINEGTWEVRVPYEGQFTYFYKVDGKVFIPECPLREKDDFGAENCLFSNDL